MLIRFLNLCVFLAVLAMPRLAGAQLIYALTQDNHLEVFPASAPAQMLSRVPIRGLAPDTVLLAIDFRPLDRQLYALGVVLSPKMVEGRLYRIHPTSGAATPIGAAPLALPALDDVGFDFNPITDQIRVVTRTRVNFRLDPATGTMIDSDPTVPGIQPDTPLSADGIVAAGHGLNFVGAPFTPLYAIDSQTDALVYVGDPMGTPNTGTVTPIGPLGIDALGVVGLDVGLPADQLYAVIGSRVSDDVQLLRINPSTGAATPTGTLARPGGAQSAVRDIAVLSFPVTAHALTDDGHLRRFKTSRPTDLLGDLPITGLSPGEFLIGLDFEPRGAITAVSNLGHVYDVDRLRGGASRRQHIGPIELSPLSRGIGVALDPANRLRLIDDIGTHLTVDLAGSVTRAPLSRSGIVAIAYSGTAAGQSPTLYGIDDTDNVLVRIGGPGGSPSPDGGEVTVIGPLGIDIDPAAGFDIDPASNMGYVTRRLSRTPPNNDLDLLYAVDLGTGTATLAGTINTTNRRIRTFALASPGVAQLVLLSNTFTPAENAGNVQMRVLRSGGDEPFAVEYATGSGTAEPGLDYTAASGTLMLLEGQQDSLPITIPILNDTVTEFDFENFALALANPTSGVQLYSGSSATFHILDDESPPNAPPTIAITSPTASGTFEAHSRFVTLSGTASDDRGVTEVFWADDRGNEGAAQGTTNWVVPSIPIGDGTTTIRVFARDVLFYDSRATLTVTLAPAAFTSLLAEGATGEFFDLDILLANPEGIPVPATLTFLKPDGSTVTHAQTLPPKSRTTIRVDEIPGMDATTASTVVTSTHPVIVERTMRWSEEGYGAHTEKAVDAPAPRWYFAEGSQGFFFTYLLLANPQAVTNSATVEYLREGAPPVTRTYSLAPLSRLTVDAGADPDLVDRSFGMTVTFAQPGVAERAMYFGLEPIWKAGHESAGITTPSATWFLAEGATGPFFETFILLANPQPAPADVTLTYLVQGGAPLTKTHTIPASGRLTLNVEAEDPALANVAVATQIVSSLPIVVERAQYWPFTPDQWHEAHNSFGVMETARDWALAEGRVGGPQVYETYILLANPGTRPAQVTITFLRRSGDPVVKSLVVPPTSRWTVATGPGGPVPELADEEFSAVIASTEPIAVERAMYSTVGGVVWSAGTNATATRFRPIE